MVSKNHCEGIPSDCDEDFHDWLHKDDTDTITDEFWDISEDEINCDNNNEAALPNVSVNHDDVVNGSRVAALVKWIAVFLFLWATQYSISTAALDTLLSFWAAIFEQLGSIFPVMASLFYLKLLVV